MCDPATLIIAGTAASTIGTVYGGLAARAQGKYQAQVADQNANLAAESGRQEQQNTRDAALQHYRKVAQLQGQQRVAMAAGGLDLGFGNAADMMADTNMLAREDAGRIYRQGAENVRGFDIEGANYRAEGAAAKQKGNSAFVGSMFSAAGTALGGAQQYSKMKSQGFS